MKAQITAISFDIGPEEVHPDLKGAALSLRSDSPMFDPEEHYEGQMLQAYVFPSNLEETLAKETGLRIVEADHHYTLQVTVDVTEEKQPLIIFNIQKKLQQFVARHFNPYIPASDKRT